MRPMMLWLCYLSASIVVMQKGGKEVIHQKGLIGWKLLPVFTLANNCPFASKLELCVPKIVKSEAKSFRDDFCKHLRLLYFFKTLDFETHSPIQNRLHLWQYNTFGWHRKKLYPKSIFIRCLTWLRFYKGIQIKLCIVKFLIRFRSDSV